MNNSRLFLRIIPFLFWAGPALLGLMRTDTAFAQSASCIGCVPLTLQRLPKPAENKPADNALTTPSFESSARSVPFGSTVRIVAPGSPTGSVLEYSKDNGTTWTAGSEVVIDSKASITARVRLNQATSPLVQGNFTPYYQRMLVIGNSIMFHGPAPELGWTNSNGMAASAPEKDFVHLLTGYLQTLNPAMTLRLQAGTGLELNFGQPGYKMDEFEEALSVFKPDLIIVRLGENVSDGEVISRNFEGQFGQLISKLQTYGPPVRIITTTSVWEKPQTDRAIRNVINAKGLPLVDLSSMVGQSQYFATQFPNKAVAAHPGDLGMQRIADLLWEQIR